VPLRKKGAQEKLQTTIVGSPENFEMENRRKKLSTLEEEISDIKKKKLL